MTDKIQQYIDEQEYLKENSTYIKYVKILIDEYPNPREVLRKKSIEQLNSDWILSKSTKKENQTMKTKFINDYKEVQNINSLLNNSNKDIIDVETLDSKDEPYSLPKEINFENLINEEK